MCAHASQDRLSLRREAVQSGPDEGRALQQRPQWQLWALRDMRGLLHTLVESTQAEGEVTNRHGSV